MSSTYSSRAWERVFSAARKVQAAGGWRHELAMELSRATGTRSVCVVTSPPSLWAPVFNCVGPREPWQALLAGWEPSVALSGLEAFATAAFVSELGELLGMALIEAKVTPARLQRLSLAASDALNNALALARGLGAEFPQDFTAPLSERERDVALLAAAGYSNLNIASRLRIAENTVGVHMRRVYQKLGVHSRVDLAKLLRQ